MATEPWLTRLIDHVRRATAPADTRTADEKAGENLLPPESACPRCGERRADALAWDEDGRRLTCTVCGLTWNPNA
jgi:ribosomal protein S27AE